MWNSFRERPQRSHWGDEILKTLVTDEGFATDEWSHGFVELGQLSANVDGFDIAVDLPIDADPSEIAGELDRISLIRINFPSFSDGRGFSHARNLRRMGFKGRLRASGHVIADQYAMARRSGFDEIEIDEELAARQPEDQWLKRADWQAHDYQNRLRA